MEGIGYSNCFPNTLSDGGENDMRPRYGSAQSKLLQEYHECILDLDLRRDLTGSRVYRIHRKAPKVLQYL